MGAHHHHGSDAAPVALSRRLSTGVAAALAVLLAATVVGLVVLWPSKHHFTIAPSLQTGAIAATHTLAGTVQGINGKAKCGGPQDVAGSIVQPSALTAPAAAGSYNCTRALIELTAGADKGKDTVLEFTGEPGDPVLHQGDHVRMVRSVDSTGVVTYYFADFARGLPLTLLAILFAVVVVAIARLRGLAALFGIVLAFGILVEFVLPALLSGQPPLAVALVAGSAIMFVVLYLSHGFSWRTSTALLGTLGALALTGLLSLGATDVTHITGLQNEENTSVQVYAHGIQLTGLLLAGFVIGSLGVLNDVTITQASAVFELADGDATASRRLLFTRGMRIGRDHIASTVYTLVLAYAGSALPILLLFTVAGRSLHDTITSDIVDDEIVRSLVGGIGLALAVPITTLVAAGIAAHQKQKV
jgi:uncharacterized membrane protein